MNKDKNNKVDSTNDSTNHNNDSNNDNNGINEFGIPVLQQGEPIYKFYIRLEKFLLVEHIEKKKKILTFINNWYYLKYNNKTTFKELWHFRDQYYKTMPDNIKSKEFLIKNFKEYDEYFKLDLEYDEKLFTTYNVLYFIKLCLKSIKGTMKKDIEEINENGVVKKNKIYTINVK